MKELIERAERLAERLKQRGETVTIAESSTGGLISAALLSIPGASDYFVAGAVIYTVKARQQLLAVADSAMSGIRPATEAYARLLATVAKQRFDTTWALAETGATGPAGNRYGDPPGHSALALAGPLGKAITVETGRADRVANMFAFAAAGLDLLSEGLEQALCRA